MIPNPDKHKREAGGRRAWPKVFVYRFERDGKQVTAPLPPGPGIPYRYVVYKQPEFDALSRSGALFDPAHTGRDARIEEDPAARKED